MSSPSPAVRKCVLSFAASDPTGGAGLQADLLTIAALGCHPLSVVTAITVQDTSGVQAMLALEPRWVSKQARALLDEITVQAFKLGVLGSAQNARAVAETLQPRRGPAIVLDPVLASARGDPLADEQTMDALFKWILPFTTIATPNSIEARRLVPEARTLAECARRLLGAGCQYVLITGTHESTAEVVNTLYDANGVRRQDRWPRLPGSYHGSGCTLASAIAAYCALGLPMDDAVREAQAFTWQSLKDAFRPGGGQFIPERRARG
jgi:hydroxymethylpyrimidine/phosphomethylpyrimidine kinase